MHIPDGFLNARTAVTAGALAATGLGLALRDVRRTVPASRVPLVGLAGAFVFAAQMLNFPVAGGTSGHLIGGVLAAVLLGPSAAVLVMSAVLILQCFMFADGGVTALGANIFNMAIVAPSVGYAVYVLVRRLAGGGLRSQLLATGFAAWCSTVVAAIVCAAELAASGTVAWRVSFPAMAGVHMLIGIGEGVITTLVVAAVARVRPELLRGGPEPVLRRSYRAFAIYGLLVALGLAFFIAPAASKWPDGLERVAGRLGFEHRAQPHPVVSPLPDYTVPGLGSPVAATIVAGGIGTLAAFALAYVLARVLTPARAKAERATTGKGRFDAPRAA
ncbi:MAG TPA: energy-coupling factor ABC transporter permease [bacterium]|nr:energy-coupling factor ABC transporter permease [bacterium]